jgi:hypothetical protein
MITALLALVAVAVIVLAFGHLLGSGLVGAKTTLPHALLFGYGGMALAALLLNFFVPLQVAAVLLPGATLIGLGAAVVGKKIAIPTPSFPPLSLGLAASILAWFVAGKAATMPFADAGLYHFPAIAWAQQETLPLGLANLHLRLGFNSLWLTLVAMVPPSFDLVFIYAVNASLTWIALGHFLLVLRDSHSPPEQKLYAGIAFFGIATIAAYCYSSPSTDLPAAIFALFAFYFALRLVVPVNGRDTTTADMSGLLVAVVLAVLVKLSQLPLAILLILCMPKWNAIRLNSLVMIFVSSLVVLWVLRGIFLTGCLVFPVATTCISWLPWTVPEELVRFYSMLIRVWPRDPSDYSSLSSWTWVPGWLQRHGLFPFPSTRHGIMIAIAAVAGLTAIVIALWASMVPALRIRLKMTLERFGLLLLTAWVSLVFWFIQAPEPRFAYGTLIAMPAISLLFIARVADYNFAVPSGASLMWAVVLLLTLVCLRYITATPNRTLVSWPVPTAVKNNVMATHDGVLVNYPPSGECWYSSVLCTPEFRPELTVEKMLGRTLFRLPASLRAPN